MKKGSNKGKKGDFDSLLLREILDSREKVFKERKYRRAGFLDGVFVRRKVENQGITSKISPLLLLSWEIQRSMYFCSIGSSSYMLSVLKAWLVKLAPQPLVVLVGPADWYVLIACYGSWSDTFRKIPKHKYRGTVAGEEWYWLELASSPGW